MAYDKTVDTQQLNTGLGLICDAIRQKSGSTELLGFPFGIAAAVDAVSNGGLTGTEVTLTSTMTSMDKFAKAIFPSWPNGFEPNSFYVCFWNGLFDGSTPINDQVTYIATWTDSSGVAKTQNGGACCRYRNGWMALAGITSNWSCAVSIGDKYTWYKIA